MKIRKMFLGLLAGVGLMGVLWVSTGQALDFEDWNQVWFKVQVKENPNGGKAKLGDAIPPGSSSLTNYQDSFKTYLVVETCDGTGLLPACDVTLCTFDGTIWSRQPSGTWPLLAGNAQKFTTLFDFTYTENPVTPITQRFLVPLLVKASVKNSNPHQISGASVQNQGGAFLVTVGDPAEQYATGSVQITSTWINPNDVPDKVPAGCKITMP
jgi:hypothetical protein